MLLSLVSSSVFVGGLSCLSLAVVTMEMLLSPLVETLTDHILLVVVVFARCWRARCRCGKGCISICLGVYNSGLLVICGGYVGMVLVNCVWRR